MRGVKVGVLGDQRIGVESNFVGGYLPDNRRMLWLATASVIPLLYLHLSITKVFYMSRLWIRV